MNEQNLVCRWKPEDQAQLTAVEQQSAFLIAMPAADTQVEAQMEVPPSKASDVLGDRVTCSMDTGIFVHNPHSEAINISSTDIAVLAGKIMNCCQEFRYDTLSKAKYSIFWWRNWYGAGSISSERHGFNVWKVATHFSNCPNWTMESWPPI